MHNWYQNIIIMSAPEKAYGLVKLCDSTIWVEAAGTSHFRHRQFVKSFEKLPAQIQARAREAFQRLLADPGLVNLKPLPGNPSGDVYSAQIGDGYRALARKSGNHYIWYWIGTHERYNRQKDQPAPNANRPQNSPAPQTQHNQTQLENVP